MNSPIKAFMKYKIILKIHPQIRNHCPFNGQPHCTIWEPLITEYQPPTGGTEQEMNFRFPAFFMPETGRKEVTHLAMSAL